MKYVCRVTRSLMVFESAPIEVEASSPEEAARLAIARAQELEDEGEDLRWKEDTFEYDAPYECEPSECEPLRVAS